MAFTILGKHVIVLGDKTTHGGEVITGSGNFRYLGKPVARVGDKVSCPKCDGVFEITEGVASAFDHGNRIAVHDCLTSCGARLIAAGEQSSVWGEALSKFFESKPDPELIPGRGLPKEEYCKYVMLLKNSQVVRDTLRKMAVQTAKDNVEYSCWIVQDPDGSIRVENYHTDNRELRVYPGEKPEGAICELHSHTSSGFPSKRDYEGWLTTPVEKRPYVYGVLCPPPAVRDDVSDEDIWKMMWKADDNGNDLFCD